MSLSNSLTFPGQWQFCTYLILLKTGLDLTLKNGFLDARLLWQALALPFLAVSPYIIFEHHVICQNKQQTSV